jgi:hypothetical protein
MRTTRCRVERLRRLLERDGPCPRCARVVLVGPGHPGPGPCPYCGREPDVILVEEVVVGPEDG